MPSNPEMKMDPDKLRFWIRPEVRALRAYHVPDAGGLIKLDAMENPYPWPPALVEEWLAVLRGVSVNRYPDPQARLLKERLREAMDVPAGMELVLGNGSDELIQLIALALAAPGRVLLAPEPSFAMYRMIAAFTGMEYVGVPLRGEDFGLDMSALREAIARHQPAVIFLASPNNPTGNLFPEAQVRELIAAAPGLVVVDEAYVPFAETSFMPVLGQYDHLLILRTLSKLGLAGLRLGVLAGPPDWLREIDKLRLPYNINVLTQASAEFALRRHALFDAQAGLIRAQREQLAAQLRALPGIRAYPSAANFILLRVPPGRADALFEALKTGGVLVKNLHGSHDLLADCLRVTVGTPQENQAFIAALARSL